MRTSGCPSEIFRGLHLQPPDPLLSLTALYRADPRPHRLDLGVGVYRTSQGTTPVLKAVKEAEAALLGSQDTKAYLGPEGDVGFLMRIAPVVFGEGATTDDLIAVQTPGGTGALRLAADLIAAGAGNRRIWMGTPSWPIHAGIFRQAGLDVRAIPYFNARSQELEFNRFFGELEGASPGDAVLLHGCCHNPSGADFTAEQWGLLGELLSWLGAVPLVDLAYQGLGAGLDADAYGLRHLMARCPIVMVAQSCDKNFGLYRERTGALFIQTPATVRDLARSNLLQLARCAWSMPPDHGAAIVRTVLESPDLAWLWRAELEQMRERLNGVREALAEAVPGLAAIRCQRGLFAQLPLGPETVDAMRRHHAIYMAASGRINVAGLNMSTIPNFAQALAACAADVPA